MGNLRKFAGLVVDQRWEAIAERKLRKHALIAFVAECFAEAFDKEELKQIGELIGEVKDVIYPSVLKELRRMYAERLEGWRKDEAEEAAKPYTPLTPAHRGFLPSDEELYGSWQEEAREDLNTVRLPSLIRPTAAVL